MSISVIAIGDVALNGYYVPLLDANGPLYPFRRIAPMWSNADVRIANLESPITRAPKQSPSSMGLRAAAGAAVTLAEAKFDCVSLSNNHIMDYGWEGARDTCCALEQCGIAHVGVGKDLYSALRPVIIQRKDVRIGILSFCNVERKAHTYATSALPGAAPLNTDVCVPAIADLRHKVDFVIVNLHWGVEMSQLPSPDQRVLARTLVMAGADVILGHHPHVLQPIEIIDGKPVVYSLGNFIFSPMYWRGVNAAGQSFCSKLRLHQLSRQTGWVNIELEKGKLPLITFVPAFLNARLQVVSDTRAARRSDSTRIAKRLSASDYSAEFEQEEILGHQRTSWRWSWKRLDRRIEMKMFQYGLLPWAVEGT